MKLMNKKGNINALQMFIMGIAGVAVTLAIVLYILSGVTETIELSNNPSWTSASHTATAAGNTTGDVITALAKAPVWIGILIIVFLAALILGYFAVKQR